MMVERAVAGEAPSSPQPPDLVGLRVLAQGVKDGVFRRRLEYPVLKRAVRERQMLFGATVVLIEDKASGPLIQDLTDG